MAKTIDELKSAAAVVRDATEEHENTALRIGQLLLDTIEALGQAGTALSGLKAVKSIDELPVSPSSKTIGYIVDTRLYVYVGTGGDALDGKYKDCGEFRGPEGEKGEPGADGHDGVSLGEVAIVDNLTEGGSDKVLSAEMGKVIRMQVETILSSLGDYAFPNGKPTLDWSGTSVRITTNLVDVISSNPATFVDKNGSYTTTLSGIHEGNLYVMDVVVKMGSVDITSTCFNEETGVVDIPNVTDTIDITATQETYVQDGLVLHLDGKNRGGSSGHWVSLVDYNGTPIDFTLTNCDETHDSYVAGNGTTSKGIGSVDTLDVSPTTGTIEALYDGADWNNDTLAILHNRGSSSVNHIGLTSWHKAEFANDHNLLTIAMGSKVDTTSKIGAKFQKTTIIGGGLVSCLNNSFVINDTEPVAGFYEGSTQAADSTSMLSIFYRKVSANERYFKLNLYSIRVYSRHLTDEERAQNNRVDKKRFNII